MKPCSLLRASEPIQVRKVSPDVSLLGVGKAAQNRLGAIPHERVFGDHPIEHRDLGASERKAHAFGVARLTERFNLIPKRLLEKLSPHDPLPEVHGLCRLWAQR